MSKQKKTTKSNIDKVNFTRDVIIEIYENNQIIWLEFVDKLENPFYWNVFYKNLLLEIINIFDIHL